MAEMNAPRVTSLDWLALTVWLEARGEGYDGKLGVAWAIVNRAKRRHQSIADCVFQAWQFSGWNTSDPNRLSLDDTEGDPRYDACYRAACAAWFGLSEDPSKGADHYLNEALVKKTAGKLPTWWDPEKITARVGAHAFARLA